MRVDESFVTRVDESCKTAAGLYFVVAGSAK